MKPSEFRAMMDKANSAADKGGSFEQLPPGLYAIEVNKVWRNKSKSSQRDQISFAGKVLEGEHMGASHFWHCGLVHEIGLQILLNELRTMGVDTHVIHSFDDFDAVCANLTTRKPVLAIRIVKKGEYFNSKVEQVLGWNGEDESAAPAPAASPALKAARRAPVPVAEEDEVDEVPDEPAEEEKEEKEKKEEKEEKEEATAEAPEKEDSAPAGEEEQEVDLAPGMKIRFIYQKKEVVGVVKKIISDDDIRVTYNEKLISLKSVEIIGLED
jgi:hypothetical protein